MKTLLDFPEILHTAKGDKAYAVRGTGVGRDKALVMPGPLFASSEDELQDFNAAAALNSGRHLIRAAASVPANAPQIAESSKMWVLVTERRFPFDAANCEGFQIALAQKSLAADSAESLSQQSAIYRRTISGSEAVPVFGAWETLSFGQSYTAASDFNTLNDGWGDCTAAAANAPATQATRFNVLQITSTGVDYQIRTQLAITDTGETYQRTASRAKAAGTAFTWNAWRYLSSSLASERSVGTGVFTWTSPYVTDAGMVVTIKAGSGYIAPKGSQTQGTYVQWAETQLTISFTASQLYAWIYVEETGAVQWTTATPSADFRRDHILLCSVASFTGTTIAGVTLHASLIESGLHALSDLLTITGSPKSGMTLTASIVSTAPKMNIAAGKAFILGGNGGNFANPNIVTYPGTGSTQFAVVQQQGIVTNAATTIPTTYDNNTAAPVAQGANNWTTHRVYWKPSISSANGLVVLQLGQTSYSTSDYALAALETESHAAHAITADMILLGYICIQKDATQLSQIVVRTASSWGGGASAASASAAASDYIFNGYISDPDVQYNHSGWTIATFTGDRWPLEVDAGETGLLDTHYAPLNATEAVSTQTLYWEGRVFVRTGKWPSGSFDPWGVWREQFTAHSSNVPASNTTRPLFTGSAVWANTNPEFPADLVAHASEAVVHSNFSTRREHDGTINGKQIQYIICAVGVFYRERAITNSAAQDYTAWTLIGSQAGVNAVFESIQLGRFVQTSPGNTYGVGLNGVSDGTANPPRGFLPPRIVQTANFAKVRGYYNSNNNNSSTSIKVYRKSSMPTSPTDGTQIGSTMNIGSGGAFSLDINNEVFLPNDFVWLVCSVNNDSSGDIVGAHIQFTFA